MILILYLDKFLIKNFNFDLSLTDISAVFRPIKTVAEGIPAKRKIFTYNPFPLYFVAKMRDNASFNNLSIREEIGDFDRTITPKLYKPLDTSTPITLAPITSSISHVRPAVCQLVGQCHAEDDRRTGES